MSSKVLFLMGIVAAHGALAAGWVSQEAPKDRLPVTSCVKTPGSLPDFTPPAELLALAVVPIDHREARQP